MKREEERVISEGSGSEEGEKCSSVEERRVVRHRVVHSRIEKGQMDCCVTKQSIERWGAKLKQ